MLEMGSSGQELLRRKRKSVTEEVDEYAEVSENLQRRFLSVPFVTVLFGVGMLSGSMIYASMTWNSHVPLYMETEREGLPMCEHFRYRDHFATKSMYIPPSPRYSLDTEGTLVHVSLVARHGARFPTKKNSIRLAKLHDVLLSTKTNRSPDWLTHQQNPYHISMSGNLTNRGKK